MKMYLAHPLDHRHWVRKKELEIEKLGMELLNPIYDLDRPEIKELDKGKITRFDISLDYIKIVNQDLLSISECDGLVAYIAEEASIGTSMEIFFAMTIGMPVYVISEKFLMHPWIRYMIRISNGQGFHNFDEFKTFIKGEINDKNSKFNGRIR